MAFVVDCLHSMEHGMSSLCSAMGAGGHVLECSWKRFHHPSCYSHRTNRKKEKYHLHHSLYELVESSKNSDNHSFPFLHQ